MNPVSHRLSFSSSEDDCVTNPLDNKYKYPESTFTGIWYKASFKDSKYGDIVVNNKKVYEGFFKDDLAHGYGTYNFSNGMVFEGSFEKGFLEGKGSLTSSDKKALYIGQFHHGSAIGPGKLSCSNGTLYEGEFNHQVDAEMPIPHGQGKITYKGEQKYIGSFVNGAPR